MSKTELTQKTIEWKIKLAYLSEMIDAIRGEMEDAQHDGHTELESSVDSLDLIQSDLFNVSEGL